jgi:biopolymer transport protein ExbB
MFESAHIVVKAVMVGLAFASVVTWTIGLAKLIEIVAAKRKLRRQSRIVATSADLAAAAARLEGSGMLEGVAASALNEIQLSRASLDRSAVRERVSSEIERIVVTEALHRVRGMGVLATIGATAPFVGLFGTVWAYR